MKSIKIMLDKERAILKRKEIERKELFIDLIREKPCIWNTKLIDHRDRNITTAAWTEICTITNQNKNEAQNSWRYLKDQFRTNWSVVRKTKSGQEYVEEQDVEKITWPFFKQLLFLKDVVKHRETSSNVELDVQPEETPNNDLEATRILSTLGQGNCDDLESTPSGSKSSEQDSEAVPNYDELSSDENACLSSTTDSSNNKQTPTFTAAKKLAAKVLPVGVGSTARNMNKTKKRAAESEAVDSEIDLIDKQITLVRTKNEAKTADTSEKFCNFLSDRLRQISPNLITDCEMDIFELVNKYIKRSKEEEILTMEN